MRTATALRASMSDPSPRGRELQALLNGFDFYSARERLAADDLLVRQTASDDLDAASGIVRRVRGNWASSPALRVTREHPLPTIEVLEMLRLLEGVEHGIAIQAERIRTATLPETDRTWRYLRSDGTLLELLLEYDLDLVKSARQIRRDAEELYSLGSPDGLGRPALQAVQDGLKAVQESFRKRQDSLRVPGL